MYWQTKTPVSVAAISARSFEILAGVDDRGVISRCRSASTRMHRSTWQGTSPGDIALEAKQNAIVTGHLAPQRGRGRSKFPARGPGQTLVRLVGSRRRT